MYLGTNAAKFSIGITGKKLQLEWDNYMQEWGTVLQFYV